MAGVIIETIWDHAGVRILHGIHAGLGATVVMRLDQCSSRRDSVRYGPDGNRYFAFEHHGVALMLMLASIWRRTAYWHLRPHRGPHEVIDP